MHESGKVVTQTSSATVSALAEVRFWPRSRFGRLHLGRKDVLAVTLQSRDHRTAMPPLGQFVGELDLEGAAQFFLPEPICLARQYPSMLVMLRDDNVIVWHTCAVSTDANMLHDAERSITYLEFVEDCSHRF